jgi:hypothetical protein
METKPPLAIFRPPKLQVPTIDQDLQKESHLSLGWGVK